MNIDGLGQTYPENEKEEADKEFLKQYKKDKQDHILQHQESKAQKLAEIGPFLGVCNICDKKVPTGSQIVSTKFLYLNLFHEDCYVKTYIDEKSPQYIPEEKRSKSQTVSTVKQIEVGPWQWAK